MPAQFINWKLVGIATALTALLVGIVVALSRPDGQTALNTSATSVPQSGQATTTTAAGPVLTQPPVAGAPAARTAAPTASPSTVPALAAQTPVPVITGTPTTRPPLVFQPPTFSTASFTRCTRSQTGTQGLVTVEWLAHVSGGSNWRAFDVIKSQTFPPTGNDTTPAYDLSFLMTTVVQNTNETVTLPTKITFASTVPYDTTKRALSGPSIQFNSACN